MSGQKNKVPHQRKLSQREILAARGEKGIDVQARIERRRKARGGMSRKERKNFWAKYDEIVGG